ncbi:hypothetical protein D3C80_435380 [compost metagenome]
MNLQYAHCPECHLYLLRNPDGSRQDCPCGFVQPARSGVEGELVCDVLKARPTVPQSEVEYMVFHREDGGIGFQLQLPPSVAD